MTGLYLTIGFYSQYHDLKNKKWTIQGPDISIELGPDVEEGEDMIWAKNTPKPRQWVNKQHSEAAQCYMLVSYRPSIISFLQEATLLLKLNCFGAFHMPSTAPGPL